MLLVKAALKAVEALKQIRKQRQELLIEEIVAAASDGAEQSAEKQEVVIGVFGRFRQLHGLIDDGVKMRFQHLLILLSE